MQATTEHEIFARLTPVCSAQRRRAVLQATGRGLLGGSAIAVALGLVNLALGTAPLFATVLPDASWWLVRWGLLPGVAVVALLAGPSIAAWRAARRKPDRHAAAAAVDRHYGLDDRTRTALAFLEKIDRKPLEEMQIADCAERLAGLDPRAVVPGGLPKPWGAALALSLLAVAAIAGPLAIRPPTCPAVAAQGTETGAQGAKAAGAPATGPTDERPAAGAPPSAPLAAEIKWRVAPSAEVVVTRANLLDGVPLEEAIFDEDRPGAPDRSVAPGDADKVKPGGPTQIVLEGELVPWRHRLTVRRYFRSLRPDSPRRLE
ncbi:MAG TPA: hypothetical protein VMY37_14875 [Thermoguttaceae bacterium]|nr:hypothetical protein [Thermoguttaceae bacterium]